MKKKLQDWLKNKCSTYKNRKHLWTFCFICMISMNKKKTQHFLENHQMNKLLPRPSVGTGSGLREED